MAKKTKDSNLSLEERLEQALIPNWDELYKLPDNWCWTKLESIANWGSGGTPSRKNPEYYIGDIPWVKTGELNNSYIYETEEHISEKAVSNSSARLFPINTVVIAMYGATIGKVGILGIEATTNQACACGVCSSAVDYKYLFYYAISQRDDFISKGKGGAQPNISQEIIKQHEIPLPPLAEQRRIISYIESLFSKLDEAKEKVQEVVDGYESRKAAILHKAFSGELTAKWREENGVDIESWQQIVLGDYADSQYGYTESSSFELSGPKFLRITDIQNGQVDWKSVPYCKITASDKEKYSLKFGDIVVARTGATTGKSYLIVDEVDAVYASYLIRVSIKSHDLINSYLYTFMQSPNYWQQISELSSGIAQPGVNGKKLQKLELPLPIAHEQLEIVSICENLLSKESRAKEIAEAVIEQIDAMKKAILARAFRGELGTNDPTEASAIELIKQIIEEKIKAEESKPKRTQTKRKEVGFVAKTILEVLKFSEKLTPEKLKAETSLEVDDFYDQLKVLIDNGQIREIRIEGESYLEAVK